MLSCVPMFYAMTCCVGDRPFFGLKYVNSIHLHTLPLLQVFENSQDDFATFCLWHHQLCNSHKVPEASDADVAK